MEQYSGMRKLTVTLLSLCLAWTTVIPAYAAYPTGTSKWDEAEIRARYPDARIIRVESHEYPVLESTLARQGYRQAGERLLLGARFEDLEAERTVRNVGESAGISRTVTGDCGESYGDRGAAEGAGRVTLDTLNGFDDATAALVFVIIGTVVVIVWSLYAFKFLYDIAAGIEPCGRWSELVASASAISTDSEEHARFNGLRFMGGFREGFTDYGLSAEVGRSDINLQEAGALKLEGTYWLLGPVLRWRMDNSWNPSYFQMEFLAGSTENREVGLLAQAKAGLSFGFEGGFRFGLNFGALNINLKDNQGIITDRSKYYYLLGVETGVRF